MVGHHSNHIAETITGATPTVSQWVRVWSTFCVHTLWHSRRTSL